MARTGPVHHLRRWAALLAAAALLGFAALRLLPGNAGNATPRTGAAAARAYARATEPSTRPAAARVRRTRASARAVGSPPRVSVEPAAASAPAGPRWAAVAYVGGAPAAWLARRGNVTLMRFDQRLVHLDLHAGIDDGGESGWVYGDRVTPGEFHRLLAGFNGGFKLSYPHTGFFSAGHTAVPLSTGLGSLVTYAGGVSDVGAWREELPAPGSRVFSVLQNQRMLVDGGRASPTTSSCILRCWGATIGGVAAVARTGIGVDATGAIVWAAGERLTPAELARALIAAGAVRAMELDINPYWVGGYLYEHGSGGPTPVPVVPGQHGIRGELLEPDLRDFIAVVANR